MNNNELNKTFNIESSEISTEVEELKPIEIDDDFDIKKDIRKDYKYSRGNIYSIIEKGQEAINGALEMAQETESPRAYEVTGQLIKNVADATEKLLELQKKLKDIEEIKDKKGPSNVTNALFIGSTAELTKFIKQQKSQGDDK
jgi:Pyruvate/2-oxoacid:ferredoxin oxidoreductase gamma subunit